MNVRKVLCWQIFSFDFGLCVVPALNAVFCERGRTLAHYIYIYIYIRDEQTLSFSLSLFQNESALFIIVLRIPTKSGDNRPILARLKRRTRFEIPRAAARTNRTF